MSWVRAGQELQVPLQSCHLSPRHPSPLQVPSLCPDLSYFSQAPGTVLTVRSSCNQGSRPGAVEGPWEAGVGRLTEAG